MEKWYVKNTEGKVFGPIDLATLVKWTKDGRIEPLAGLSTDLKHWCLAPQKAELEMDWVIENTPSQFYGPVHRDQIDAWIQSGTLSPDARFYRSDRDAEKRDTELEAVRSQCAALESHYQTLQDARTQTEQALAETQHEKARLEEEKARLEEQAQRFSTEIHQLRHLLSETETEASKSAENVTRLQDEIKRLQEEIKQLQEEQTRAKQVHARTWETEVLVPEIVQDAPHPVTPALFKPSARPSSNNTPSLADLERQAQAELARMGAAGAKNFFNRRK
jgi:hypothetical protein